MAQSQAAQAMSPTADSWSFAVDMLKIDESIADINFDALRSAVAEAVTLVDQIEDEKASRPTHALAKRKLRKLERVLASVEFELESIDTQQGLKETTAARHMARLLSSAAVEQISGATSNSLNAPQSRQLGPEQRRMALEGMPATAMLFAIRQIKEPIDDWLYRNARNNGGRPVKTARQAILFCLTKNYEAIMNQPLQPESKQHLKLLATHVFGACKIDTAGLEDACGRAFDEFASWAAWHNLPAPTFSIGPVDIDAIPDDPETPLAAAKPRPKK
jgi:hypothetical protein